MSETSVTRREFITTATLSGGAALLSAAGGFLPGMAEAATSALPEVEPFPRKYIVKPLPFKPESLRGLSPKLIVSHWEKNYQGALKNLMKVEEQIKALPTDVPPFVLTGLKTSEHAFRNSMILHEQYFDNLGGNGKIQGKVEKLISKAWGSVGKFESEFKTAGNGVGGGTGWVILTWDLRTAQPVMSTTGHNNQFPAHSIPLLLMDVYEHAYAIDFGAGIKDYIEAFFNNINWEIVNKRLELAQRISKIV